MVQEEGGRPLDIAQRTGQDMRAHHNIMQQMNQLEQRLRITRTPEERTQLFNELKRTPHLFSSFLKMGRNDENHQQFPAVVMFSQSFARDFDMQQGPPGPARQQQPQQLQQTHFLTTAEIQNHDNVVQQMIQFERRLRNTRTPEERKLMSDELRRDLRRRQLFNSILKMCSHPEEHRRFPATVLFAQTYITEVAQMTQHRNRRVDLMGVGQGIGAIRNPLGQGQGINPPPYRPIMGQPGIPGYNQPGVQPQMPQGMGGNPLGNHQQRTVQDTQAQYNIMQQMNQLEQRLRNTRTPEERSQLFNELKKTPHLFSVFLKMSRHQEGQQQFPATAMFAQSFARDYDTQQGLGPAWQQPHHQQQPQQDLQQDEDDTIVDVKAEIKEEVE